MKRTYQPKKRKRARTHGFRARMRRAPAASCSSAAATRAASGSPSSGRTPGAEVARAAAGCRAAPSSSASTARAARTATASWCSTPSRARTDVRRGRPAPRAVRLAQGRRRRRPHPRQAPAARGVLGGGRAAARRARTTWSSRAPTRGSSPSARARPGSRRALAELVDGLGGARDRGEPARDGVSARARSPSRSLRVRLYQRVISPALPAPLQVPPDLLGVRGAGGRAVRHTARRRAGRRGGCCAATRSATAATTPSPPRRCSAPARPTALRHTPELHDTSSPPNPLQPLIDFFEAILVFFHDNVGLGWGMSIIALTLLVRAAAAAADAQAVQVDAVAGPRCSRRSRSSRRSTRTTSSA